nr:1-pyrroline-5-carboxylate dehydrogenase [Actinomycetota bacterium]
MDAITTPPAPRNEPVRSYPPGGPQRASLTRALAELAAQRTELTMTIGGAQRMAGGERFDVVTPHQHAHVLGATAQA